MIKCLNYLKNLLYNKYLRRISMKEKVLATPIIVLALFSQLLAQQYVNPHYNTYRLDYRDLGYPNQNLIPADNARITALLSHSNGMIYGATSGRTQSYLFFFNRFINKVRPLGQIAKSTGVYHTLLEGKDQEIYIGTGLNMFRSIKLSKDFPVYHEAIEKELFKDICKPYNNYEGGHIYRYDPEPGDRNRYSGDMKTPLKDLGIPVPGQTIYAMTMNAEKTKIYGITYPYAHFFIFDITTQITEDLGEFLEKRVFAGPERTWRSVPRAVYCDSSTGFVYTSGDNGMIYRYRPGSSKLEQTNMRLPGDFWEGTSSWVYPVVEAFDVDEDGYVYAGTSDGFLVRVHIQNEDIYNLGKARQIRRMRSMKVGKDNKIYIISGEFDRNCKLHSYDLTGQKGFRELGVFAVDRSPYYAKRAYQMDSMAIGEDGTVFCGESDRRGKLFIYIPGSDVFKGGYNPYNPTVTRMKEDAPSLIPEKL